MGEPTISDLIERLIIVIEAASQLNANGKPTRSRHLSLAITYAENALYRLQQCATPKEENRG